MAKTCKFIQIANNVPDSVKAFDMNPAVATWFDHKYNEEWTADDFLEAMRSAGMTEA